VNTGKFGIAKAYLRLHVLWPVVVTARARLGALGAAAVFPIVPARAQTKPDLIDTHLHFYPPEYQTDL
jgi:hypothetical protein